VPMRCKTSLLGNLSTRPLRAYCKECNRTPEQIETCGDMAIAPRRFRHLWVQQALPGALAQAFASHMVPDPSGRTLSVTFNSVYLRGGGPADSDTMRGVGNAERRRGPGPHDAPAGDLNLYSLPVVQVLVEQAFQGRITALSQAFASWLARGGEAGARPQNLTANEPAYPRFGSRLGMRLHTRRGRGRIAELAAVMGAARNALVLQQPVGLHHGEPRGMRARVERNHVLRKDRRRRDPRHTRRSLQRRLSQRRRDADFQKQQPLAHVDRADARRIVPRAQGAWRRSALPIAH
jgi:hypothetical protein